MYIDITTREDKFPQTLIIRNHYGGMIWQVYHVEKKVEADRISKNATANGFMAITLEKHQPEFSETFPDWRETTGGKKIIED